MYRHDITIHFCVSNLVAFCDTVGPLQQSLALIRFIRQFDLVVNYWFITVCFSQVQTCLRFRNVIYELVRNKYRWKAWTIPRNDDMQLGFNSCSGWQLRGVLFIHSSHMTDVSDEALATRKSERIYWPVPRSVSFLHSDSLLCERKLGGMSSSLNKLVINSSFSPLCDRFWMVSVRDISKLWSVVLTSSSLAKCLNFYSSAISYICRFPSNSNVVFYTGNTGIGA